MQPSVPPVDLPYIHVFRAKGRLFAYYRRDGRRTRLLAADGSGVDVTDPAALGAAWARAHEAHEATVRAKRDGAPPRPDLRPRSIAHLIALYRDSDDWRDKKPATRDDYEKGLRVLEADFGALPVIGLTPVEVRRIQRRYKMRQQRLRNGDLVFDQAGQPVMVPNHRQANRVVSVLSVLMSYARTELGWVKTNPCERPKRLAAQTKGYRAWSREQFQAFCEAQGDEWHFIATFALLSGQRGQDQITVRWDAYDGRGIRFLQAKGAETVEVYVTVADTPLKAELDERKKRARTLTILETPTGKQWTRKAFSKETSLAIKAAGLRGIVWHGLRTTAASWAADGEAPPKAAQHLLGHKTPAMTEHYARDAQKAKLAAEATKAIVRQLPVIRKKGA